MQRLFLSVPISDFRYTGPPNPERVFGQSLDSTPEGQAWVAGEQQGWSVFDTEKEDPRKLYLLLLSANVPRPVALVSTVSLDRRENLALFSEPWIQQANISAIDTSPDVGEWPMRGLTKTPCIKVKPPRVKESACSMECKLLQTIHITDPATGIITTTLVLGSVKHIHVRNDVMNHRGTIDPGKMKPVARMAGVGYARISEGYYIALPSWIASQAAIRACVPDLEESAMGDSEEARYEAVRVY